MVRFRRPASKLVRRPKRTAPILPRLKFKTNGIETVTENQRQNMQCQGSTPVVKTATASAARGVGVAGIHHGVQNEPAQHNAPKKGVQIERHQHTSAETERCLRTQRRRYDRASKTRVEL